MSAEKTFQFHNRILSVKPLTEERVRELRSGRDGPSDFTLYIRDALRETKVNEGILLGPFESEDRAKNARTNLSKATRILGWGKEKNAAGHRLTPTRAYTKQIGDDFYLEIVRVRE